MESEGEKHWTLPVKNQKNDRLYQKVQNAIFYSNKHAYKSAIQIFDAV